jgi:endonuclease YncB( thermonuclease family)
MYEYKAIILDIIDNNTLVVNIDLGFRCYTKQKLRFYGAKVIESFDNSIGIEAREWMEQFIGSDVIITTHVTKRSKIGRTMGIVYTIDPTTGERSENINELLIAKKYAVDFKKWDGEI